MIEDNKLEEELVDDTNAENTNEANSENTTQEEEVVEEKELSEVEVLMAQNDLLLSKVDELKDKYTRLTADFDNLRRRTAKEKIEYRLTASKDIVTSLLDVLDDFDRTQQNEENSLSEGMLLTIKKFKRILEDQGLKEMESTNLDFNPDLHEAITKIPAPSPDQKGKVFDTVQKGYFLNDVIIRHAKVVVGQ